MYLTLLGKVPNQSLCSRAINEAAWFDATLPFLDILLTIRNKWTLANYIMCKADKR